MVVVEVATALEELLLVGHACGHVVGGRLPAVGDDRPRAQHLEVLHLAGVRRVGIVEGGAEVGAVDRLLRDAVDDRGRIHAAGVEDRRQQVDRVQNC